MWTSTASLLMPPRLRSFLFRSPGSTGSCPVARKFGAPVIAISDPGDIVAIDTLRTSIGREFISVVAAAEQIDACLDRVYGNGSQAPAVSHNGSSAAPVPGLEGLEQLGGLDDIDDIGGLDLGSMLETPSGPTDHADPLAVALGDALTRPAPHAPLPAPSPREVFDAAPATGHDQAPPARHFRRRRDDDGRPRRGRRRGVRAFRW